MRMFGKKAWAVVWMVGVLSGWIYAANVREQVERGNELFAAGKYDEAQQAYAGAQVDAPESAEVAFNLGTTFYRQGRYEEALRAFERALGAEDAVLVAKAHYNIGNTLVQQGKLREALDAYKRCLEIARDDEDAKYNIEYVQRKLKELASKQKEEQEKNPLHKLLKELEKLIALQAAHVVETRGLMKAEGEVMSEQVEALATNEQGYAERARELREGFWDVRTNLPVEVVGGGGGGVGTDDETRRLVEVYRELTRAGRAVEEGLGKGDAREARVELRRVEGRLGEIARGAGGELSRQFAEAGRGVVGQLGEGLGDTNKLMVAAEAYASLMDNLQRELKGRMGGKDGTGMKGLGQRSLGERIDAAIGHMERAVTNLTHATDLLKTAAWTNALPEQVQGLENLIRARKEFEDEQQEQQQQQQGGRGREDKEKRDQQQGQQGEEKKEEKDKGGEEKEQPQQAQPEQQQQGSQDQQKRGEEGREHEQPRMTPEQVEQLLRAFGEDQRNQQRARRQRLQHGYMPVDKDW